MPATDFEVRLARSDETDAVLAALADGYGRPFTREWFEWKHERSPWGPSRCFAAVDHSGILGVVFHMPWSFVELGCPVPGWRLVDGSTAPRGQRRGVFRAVVAAALSDAANDLNRGLTLATATPAAQLAHIKNGALALDPIVSFYRPAVWRPAQLTSGLDIVDTWTGGSSRAISTAWDPASLRWRLDPLLGVSYTVSRLARVHEPHGVVHRTMGNALRTTVVSAAWGEPRLVRRALQAIAWKSKSFAVLSPMGAGTASPQPRVALSRGRSLMCLWDPRGNGLPSATPDGWLLDGLDLEGVI